MTPPTARQLLEEPMARVAIRGQLMRPYRRWQFAEFGTGSIIDRPEWIQGGHHIAIGHKVVILRGARISAEHDTWDEAEPSVVIGDRTTFRTHLVISATSRITIEEKVLGGAFISIIDSDHTITERDVNPLANPVETAPIRIGAGSWLAERVTVLGGADIGRKCIIGAHSVVRGTIPDHSIAVGAPARVVGSTLPADRADDPSRA